MNAKWKLLLWSTLSGAVLSLSACAPECEDKFDCAKKGANYTCSSGKCVQGSGTGGGIGFTGGGIGFTGGGSGGGAGGGDGGGAGGGTATTGGGDGTTGGGDGTTGGGTATTGGGDGTTGGGTATTGGGDGTTGGGTGTTGGGTGTTGGGTGTTGGGTGTTGGGTGTTGGGTGTTGGGTGTTGGGTGTTGGGTGTTGGGTGTTGGGTGSCTELTLDPFFLYGHSSTAAEFDTTFTPALGDGALGDWIELYVYSGATGTFDLASGVNADPASCDQCLFVYEDEYAGAYYPASGSLTVTAADLANGGLTGTLNDVTLQSIDPDTGAPISGPCLHITTAPVNVAAVVPDAGVPDAGSVDAEIAQVRADATTGTTSSVTIQGAVITSVKPYVTASQLADGGVGNDPAGFFIQGSAAGPGLFIALDATTLPGGPYAAHDRVDITVSTVGLNGGVRQVTGITSIVRQSSGVPLPMSDASTAAFFDTGVLDSFESRYVTLAGTVTAASGTSGAGYAAWPIATMGTTDGGSSFLLRVPATVRDALEPTQQFGVGCTFAITGPVWRFTSGSINRAQPSVWNQSELNIISCPAPTVTGALATTNTLVAVSFSRSINAASVSAAAFSIDNGLTVLDAGLVSAQQALLQTSSQDGGVGYTVTVASSVVDLRGTGVGTPNSAAFIGIAAPTGALATNLFISEYGEGGVGNNKYIEIYNGTGAAVNLANYSLRSYTNGSATVASGAISLTGMLANGAAYTVCNTGIDATITAVHPCSMISGANPASFNGDDSIELVQGTTAIDVIGLHTGTDPGTGWPVCGIANATADHILIRKPTQSSPTTDWAASSGTTPADCQWLVSGAATLAELQTNNGIGSHTFAP